MISNFQIVYTTSYCQKKLDCGHITKCNSRRKKIRKTPFEETVEISNTQNVENKPIDTSQNNILESSVNQDGTKNEHEVTNLAEILANLIKDNIPPSLNVSEQDLCSHGETSNTTNKCEIDEENNQIKGKFVSDNVFNLSRRNITDDDLSLLSQSLSFVPTPKKKDRWQIKNDLRKYGRSVIFKMHFLVEPTPSFFEVPAFKITSKWTPIKKDTQLELYLSEIEDEILKIYHQGQNYPNLTKKEREAIKELMNDCNIIIKVADKESRIAIWDKQDYLKECENQLNDVNVYEKVEGDPVTAVNKKISKVLGNMIRKKEIDKKLAENLCIK